MYLSNETWYCLRNIERSDKKQYDFFLVSVLFSVQSILLFYLIFLLVYFFLYYIVFNLLFAFTVNYIENMGGH